MKNFQRLTIHILMTLLLITLLVPSPALAQLSAQDEVRELLRSYYVDPVPEEVLASPTIDDMLQQLGDPHTNFLTAAQYRDFNDSLEQSFSGIGIYLDIVPEGVLVIGLLSGSPSEKAGIKSGDVITSIGQHSLSGLSSEEAIPLIRGPEGSKVRLSVLRDGVTFSVLVERRNIGVPTVTDEIKAFDIAYLRISTFGSETSQLFADSLDEVRRQNPSSYIVDLRDNGGGYVTAALDIAGYFIGDAVAIQTQYRNRPPALEPAIQQNYRIDKPTIYLINQNSASASEILAGAVKDYGQALIIGTQSYGKGSMQQLFSLASGDYFKMTTAHFLSPLGHQINAVGITPDLLIEKSDPLKVAELILCPGRDQTQESQGEDTTMWPEHTTPPTSEPSPWVSFNLASHSVEIDTRQARNQEYWQAYGEIVDRVGLEIMKGTQAGEFKSINSQELSDRRSLYYPDYKLGNQLTDLPVDKKFTIHFPRSINLAAVNPASIELIAAENGERVPLTLQQLSNTELQAVPQKSLMPGASYWLVIHPGIQYTDNYSLTTGVVCTAKVGK